MEEIRYYMCRTQGNIFRIIAKEGYNLENFTLYYMKSSFCERSMDTKYSRFQVADAEECLDFILPEIEDVLKKNPNNIHFNEDIAEWIGFTYRNLYLETGIPSAKLIDKVPFNKMCNYYPGLHTIDEGNALDIIIKNMK